MKSHNIVQEKSYAFAIRIVNLYKYLCHDKKEFILSKQVFRSGTSIGANVEEAIGSVSEKDFIHKLSISYKEARETKYWLRLLHDTGYIQDDAFESIIPDCEELLKLIGSIIKTMKSKQG
jgi:four helix bundle protein